MTSITGQNNISNSQVDANQKADAAQDKQQAQLGDNTISKSDKSRLNAANKLNIHRNWKNGAPPINANPKRLQYIQESKQRAEVKEKTPQQREFLDNLDDNLLWTNTNSDNDQVVQVELQESTTDVDPGDITDREIAQAFDTYENLAGYELSVEEEAEVNLELAEKKPAPTTTARIELPKSLGALPEDIEIGSDVQDSSVPTPESNYFDSGDGYMTDRNTGEKFFTIKNEEVYQEPNPENAYTPTIIVDHENDPDWIPALHADDGDTRTIDQQLQDLNKASEAEKNNKDSQIKAGTDPIGSHTQVNSSSDDLLGIGSYANCLKHMSNVGAPDNNESSSFSKDSQAVFDGLNQLYKIAGRFENTQTKKAEYIAETLTDDLRELSEQEKAKFFEIDYKEVKAAYEQANDVAARFESYNDSHNQVRFNSNTDYADRKTVIGAAIEMIEIKAMKAFTSDLLGARKTN